MAERLSGESRRERAANLGEVVEGKRRRPRSAKRQPRVAQRHRKKRSGQTPRVTIFAKQKYATVFSELSTKKGNRFMPLCRLAAGGVNAVASRSLTSREMEHFFSWASRRKR